ncbi:unnamed protein product [Strongylus vulgaris]|uniref:DUF4440 domain-containing protein n=1 Tax=Strongylus vulgaris TaxID=40348 RepID=A0A3P7L7S5_STRVU|nr:unnamed protein product [Strongylus vulgaris]
MEEKVRIDGVNWGRIQRQEKAVFSALRKEHESFKERVGKGTPKVVDEHYMKVGDFIIINTNIDLATEKGANLKAKVTMIWRRSGDKYFVLHEEFTLTEA